MDTPPIRPRSSRVVYENRWMRVREDEIERGPVGAARPGLYAVIEKPRAGLVIPWDGERLYLVGQYRYTVGQFSWEFPQGAVHDDPEATGEQVARQELVEETGFAAGTLTKLGSITFAVGMSNQWCDCYLATELTAGPAQPEPEEEDLLTLRAVTVAEFEAMTASGELFDAASLAAWGLAESRRLRPR